MTTQEPRHPSHLCDNLTRMPEFLHGRPRRSHDIIGIGAQVGGYASANLVSLTVVVLQQTSEAALVSLGVAPAFLAMEVLAPAWAERSQKLFIAPWVGACGLQNLGLHIVTPASEVHDVTRHSLLQSGVYPRVSYRSSA